MNDEKSLIESNKSFFENNKIMKKQKQTKKENSSSGENDYKELDKEIANTLNKSKSPNIKSNNISNVGIGESSIFNGNIWNINNNESQDSQNFHLEYSKLRKKTETPKNNNEKHFVLNPNYDYSTGTDEGNALTMKAEKVQMLCSFKTNKNNLNKDNNDKQLASNGADGRNSLNPISSLQFSPLFKHNEEEIYCSYRNNGGYSLSFHDHYQSDLAEQYRNQNRRETCHTSNIPLFKSTLVSFQPNSYYFRGGSGNVNVGGSNTNPTGIPNIGTQPPSYRHASSFVSQTTFYSSNNIANNELNEIEDYEAFERISLNKSNIGHHESNSFSITNTPIFSHHETKVRMPTTDSVESKNSAKRLFSLNIDDVTKKTLDFNRVDHHFTPSHLRSQTLYHGFNLNEDFHEPKNNGPIYNHYNSYNSINSNSQSNSNIKPKSKKDKNKSKITVENEEVVNKINLDDIFAGKEKRTTIMIRNIPNRYNDQMFLNELNEIFQFKYDCFYLPEDVNTEDGKHKTNRGYAFINFVHPLHILLFYEHFQDRKWKSCKSKKICQLTFANFQGKSQIELHSSKYQGKKPLFKNWEFDAEIEIPSKYIKDFKKYYPTGTYREGTFGYIVNVLL